MRNNVVYLMLIALVAYAIPNLLLDRYLSKYSVPALLVVWEFVLFVISCIVYLYSRQTGVEMVHVELGIPLLIVIVASISYYCADYHYISAYHVSGNIVTITSMMIALPVLAGTVKSIIDWHPPSIKHVLAYVVMAIAVSLFAWAESSQHEMSASN